ncbi:RepA [hydrothermal vent metagenome]|uniref:RepA n=1 Tax=hydrothermal vent metagenome TaxID=652676 RepID=A0A3B0VR68_9ZZZZ
MKPLLPERHPNRELFICDFGDVMPKSDIASMEHPLFTLSTKPDRNIRYYEHNGNSVTIAPSSHGLATIHDKDILIYCISQLMEGINRGEVPSRTVRLRAHDLLVSTNRQTSGEGYKRLKQAFERLRGTTISTDIKTNEQQYIDVFGIIDSAKTIVESPDTKRMVELEITLSEWLYNSIIGKEVLTISRDYFRLRKPLERRIYELARKHCGNQKQWKIGVKILHKKSGTSGNVREFRRMLKEIEKHNHLPNYSLSIDSESDNVIFNSKGHGDRRDSLGHNRPTLKTDTIEKAKKIIGRNFDVYALESDWLSMWEKSGKPTLQTPDGAFINFCKKRMENT